MRDMDNMNKKDMYIMPLIFYSNEREEEMPEIINNNDDEEEILDRTVYIYILFNRIIQFTNFMQNYFITKIQEDIK